MENTTFSLDTLYSLPKTTSHLIFIIFGSLVLIWLIYRFFYSVIPKHSRSSFFHQFMTPFYNSVGVSSILILLLFIFFGNYRYEVTDTYYPSETSILHDDYEIIIKPKYPKSETFKFNITSKYEYESVMDSSFYIQEISYFNFLGYGLHKNYKLKKDNNK